MTNIRKSTIEDIDTLMPMIHKFISYSPYTPLVNTNVLYSLVSNILTSIDNSLVILMEEDHKGFIAGYMTRFIYGSSLQASELAWWVEEDYRNTNLGTDLLSAFEVWAKENNADIVCMSSLNDKLDNFYMRNGYKLFERTFMKVIK